MSYQWSLLLVAATMGVDYGWQPADDVGTEYVIQLQPHEWDALRRGADITSEIHADARHVRRFRIRIGTGPVGRENGSPIPQTDEPQVVRGQSPDNAPSLPPPIAPTNTPTPTPATVPFTPDVQQAPAADFRSRFSQFSQENAQTLTGAAKEAAGEISNAAADVVNRTAENVAGTVAGAEGGPMRAAEVSGDTGYNPIRATGPQNLPGNNQSPPILQPPTSQPPLDRSGQQSPDPGLRSPFSAATLPRADQANVPADEPSDGFARPVEQGTPDVAQPAPTQSRFGESSSGGSRFTNTEPGLFSPESLDSGPAHRPAEFAQPLPDNSSQVERTAASNSVRAGIRATADDAEHADHDHESPKNASELESEELEDHPPKPWGPMMLALVCLFVSLGANVYLGWTALESHLRYRRLLLDDDDYDDEPEPTRGGRRSEGSHDANRSTPRESRRR